MKTQTLKALFFVVIAAFSSCSSNDNTALNTLQDIVEETIQTGTWSIIKYIDSGEDKISNFSNYTFTFNSDSTLSTTIGTNNYNGTWSITDSNSSDDSLDDLHFNIYFAAPTDFEELTNDWEILSRTSTKIELIGVSGGNGGTDYLTFAKN